MSSGVNFVEGIGDGVVSFDAFDGKIFQNLRVSSPAPVTTESPSGETLKYKTLVKCPINVAIGDNPD
jgi:hypothetical protein